MTEILNFTTIEEKMSYRSKRYTKFYKKTKWPEGSIYSGAFLRKLEKS